MNLKVEIREVFVERMVSSMRDPNRIDKVLDEIKTLWKKYPDLRLGQLICNVLQDPALYYVEDNELVKYLKAYYGVEEKDSDDSSSSN